MKQALHSTDQPTNLFLHLFQVELIFHEDRGSKLCTVFPEEASPVPYIMALTAPSLLEVPHWVCPVIVLAYFRALSRQWLQVILRSPRSSPCLLSTESFAVRNSHESPRLHYIALYTTIHHDISIILVVNIIQFFLKDILVLLGVDHASQQPVISNFCTFYVWCQRL